MPIQVLFVCTANICRSAFAEALARHQLADRGAGDEVQVTSAGIHGFLDQPMDGPMAAELVTRGGDPAYFRSRRLTFDMVQDADLVLTAEVAHRTFVLDDRPAAFRKMFTFGQFERILDGLPDDVHGRRLLEAVRSALKPADPADDVPDPYRRGPGAAQDAAAHLERIVTRVVDRLSE